VGRLTHFGLADNFISITEVQSRREMMVASFIYLFMVCFTTLSFRHCCTKWQDGLPGIN
jgi:hypothetical protein